MSAVADDPVDDLVAAVRRAVAAVTDPEYPDLTIEDLGILEYVECTGATTDCGGEGMKVRVGLVPTVLGCPALRAIEADVVAAARSAAMLDVPADARPIDVAVDVVFLTSPAWSTERIRPRARAYLARELTIALRRRDGEVTCPVCGSAAVRHRSDFGPTRCREVWWCEACRNPVEVLRS